MLNLNWNLDSSGYVLQNALAELSLQLTDAKTRLADQETEIKNADSKLQLSLSEAEKLKTSFDADKNSWADEKTLLIQRAETAEAALKEVTMELTGLKNRVSQMVSAIFGESFCQPLTSLHFLCTISPTIAIQLTWLC